MAAVVLFVANVGELTAVQRRADVAEAEEAKEAVAVSSGTAALHAAMYALEIGPGDEVIVPAMTFAATANAIRYVGANPVFVDASRDTWTMDPALLDFPEVLDYGDCERAFPTGELAEIDEELIVGK